MKIMHLFPVRIILCWVYFATYSSTIFLDTNNPTHVPPEFIETDLENSYGDIARDSPVSLSSVLM